MFTDWYQDYPHPLRLVRRPAERQPHHEDPQQQPGQRDVPSVNKEIEAAEEDPRTITPEVNRALGARSTAI
jgi:hypothetical protein